MRATQRFIGPDKAGAFLLFVPFGLLNASFAGIAGIAIPLFAGQPQLAGTATALLNVGLAIGAPLSVWLAHPRRYRLILSASLVGTGGAFLALAIPQSLIFLGAAFAFGLCASAGLTLSTLFVMGWYRPPQWDTQIGWLQTWMGVGQVFGLLITVVVLSRIGLGLIGLGLSLAAGFLAVLIPSPAPATASPPPAHSGPQGTAVAQEVGGGIALHHLARFSPRHWAIFRSRALSPFFLQWGVATIGGGPIFAVFPLLMHQQFGWSQSQSAWGFAVAALLGIGLYEPAGRLAQRTGSSLVLGCGYSLRAVGLLLIAGACWAHTNGWWAIVGFGIVVLSWSALTVASNTRITEVSQATAGAELGALYALTTIAKVIGSLAGGLFILGIGYGSTMALSAALLGIAAVWSFMSLPQRALPTKEKGAVGL